MKITKMGILRLSNPTEWETRLRVALNGATYEEAAVKLGVGARSIGRWAAELGIVRIRGNSLHKGENRIDSAPAFSKMPPGIFETGRNRAVRDIAALKLKIETMQRQVERSLRERGYSEPDVRRVIGELPLPDDGRALPSERIRKEGIKNPQIKEEQRARDERAGLPPLIDDSDWLGEIADEKERLRDLIHANRCLCVSCSIWETAPDYETADYIGRMHIWNRHAKTSVRFIKAFPDSLDPAGELATFLVACPERTAAMGPHEREDLATLRAVPDGVPFLEWIGEKAWLHIRKVSKLEKATRMRKAAESTAYAERERREAAERETPEWKAAYEIRARQQLLEHESENLKAERKLILRRSQNASVPGQRIATPEQRFAMMDRWAAEDALRPELPPSLPVPHEGWLPAGQTRYAVIPTFVPPGPQRSIP
jgi:hypothetical protein